MFVDLHWSECMQLVIEDAKKKELDWQQTLHDMKLKNLLQLRDSLMATASIHMMGVDNCKTACDEEEGDQVMPFTLPSHSSENVTVRVYKPAMCYIKFTTLQLMTSPAVVTVSYTMDSRAEKWIGNARAAPLQMYGRRLIL